MENNTTTNTVAVNNKEEKKMETNMNIIVKSLKKSVILGSEKFIRDLDCTLITINGIEVESTILHIDKDGFCNKQDSVKFELDVDQEYIDVNWNGYQPTLSGRFNTYSEFTKRPKTWNEFTIDLFPEEIVRFINNAANQYAFDIAFNFANIFTDKMIKIKIKVTYSAGELKRDHHDCTLRPLDKLFDERREKANERAMKKEAEKRKLVKLEDDDEFI